MRSLVFFLVVFLPGYASADAIPVGDFALLEYPGSDLTEESIDLHEASHRVVLGSLKKINNQLKPERSETVRGRKSAYTYYLPEARRTGEVGAHFETQLTRIGQIVFQCQGRTCGSSSYWANKVLDRAILYGPEQFQQYYVAKLNDESGFVAVYVGQRATRKIYVHVEVIGTSSQPDAMNADKILAALSSNSHYVIRLTSSGEYPAAVIQMVREALLQYRLAVTVVAHDSLRAGETLDEAVNRTGDHARLFVSKIKEEGQDLDLQPRGVGPLAPSDSYGPTRLELIVLTAP